MTAVSIVSIHNCITRVISFHLLTKCIGGSFVVNNIQYIIRHCIVRTSVYNSTEPQVEDRSLISPTQVNFPGV